MAFEVVVRPVVFPNIRPAPAQPLAPADDPEQGFATIQGSGGKQIDLSSSYSASTSTGVSKEIKRQVDEARVYQKNDDGTINKQNFVDIKVAKKIWMEEGTQPAVDNKSNFPESEFKWPDDLPKPQNQKQKVQVYKYKPLKQQDNIEIRKRNIIEKSADTTSGEDE